MEFNFLAVFVAALVPILIGSVWYHPKVFGKIWMEINGFTEDTLKVGNMAIIFVVSFILSILLSFDLNFVVVHQTHVYSALMDMANVAAIDDPSTPLGAYYADFVTNYGSNFRTFKHGALHGVLATLFFILPIVGITALFERRGFKYIFLHLGYWMVCLVIMGGIISGWV